MPPICSGAFATSVRDIVNKQVELGIDVVNDGEHSKSNFAAYTGRRIGGFEPIDMPFAYTGKSRDMLEFGPVYEENRAMYAARPSRQAMTRRHQAFACTGPVHYKGQADVAVDVHNLKAATAGSPATEAFMTSLSPNMVVSLYRNRFYKTDEEYAFALADVMREEYKAITDAGIILQIDDPRLITTYDRDPSQESRGLPEDDPEADRGHQLRAARHPRGDGAVSHLLLDERSAARARPGAEGLCRPHAHDQRTRLHVRGGEPAS